MKLNTDKLIVTKFNPIVVKVRKRASSVKELLTMNRSGDFIINTKGNNHCGVLDHLVIKYNMICVCGNKLDSRGFLFDQLTIDNYFQSLYETEKSCESLTVSCVKDLLRILQEENPKCQIFKMDLTLSPEPHKASMTYSWKDRFAPIGI